MGTRKVDQIGGDCERFVTSNVFARCSGSFISKNKGVLTYAGSVDYRPDIDNLTPVQVRPLFFKKKSSLFKLAVGCFGNVVEY